MVKRRVTDERDEEDQLQNSSPASKRVRTGDEAENDAGTQVPVAERVVQGPSVDDVAVEENDDKTEEQFEAAFGDQVRASIEAKGKGAGRIAQVGIIQKLEMHQFMCHKRLSFTFGPQVNFIIGHNGSGKSAVLSAITVALGGKANSTGRGSGLKSFIREGQSVAEVSIMLKNEGDEAYKPDIYGKSIIITRRFTKDGGGSYKIKSQHEKVISTKREELSNICDHMNVQVDNPMNVLTQDAARQFLSASQPADKYKFFLKGTQLSQLSDEYEACLENMGKTAKVVEQKKAIIPDLKKQVKEATTRCQEARKALEQKAKVDDLKKELAWAHVKTKENEMKAKIEVVAKATRRLPKIEDSLKTAKEQLEEANSVVARLESELNDLGDMDHLDAEKKTLQDKIKANREKLAAIRNEERNMNGELEGNNKAIGMYEQKIAEETQKLQEDAQVKRAERERQLQAAKNEVEAQEQLARDVTEQIREKTAFRDKVKLDLQAVEVEVEKTKRELGRCSDQIDACDRQIKSRYAPYGNDMENVLERIKTARWHGEIPKGPLGLFVTLPDSQWAQVMRAQLAGPMLTFAITDARDRPQLLKILRDSQNNNTILVSGVDMFDYSGGEPPQDMLTALRALEFSDPHVLRIFINQARIERIFLARTRAEGQDIVDAQRGGGVCWTADLFRVQAYGDGGANSQKIYMNNRASTLFTQDDPAAMKHQYQLQGKELDNKYLQLLARANQLRTQIAECQREMAKLDNDGRTLHMKVRNSKSDLSKLQNQHNDDVPVSISALEEAKQDAEANKENILQQFTGLQERKNQINQEQTPYQEQLDKVKAQINEHEEHRQEYKNKIAEAIEPRLKAQNDIKHFDKKLAEEKKKVEALNEEASDLQKEFEDWTAKAEKYCERVETTRKPDEINRQLQSVQKALADREREQGATVEELQTQLAQAHERYEAAERDVKSMSNLNKVLKQSLIVRLGRWNEFRRHIALRTKLQFQYHLSNRGYYGKVLFDHTVGTLQLKVQTDDQASTQSRDKDPRSLSGGEKSFSTICLLLSLWEAIGCPIRCLDEFDVFMDAVNRRISMKMMIDTANSSDSKQYILITPQDMSIVDLGPSVRVHRMNDPERGQNTLAFRADE